MYFVFFLRWEHLGVMQMKQKNAVIFKARCVWTVGWRMQHSLDIILLWGALVPPHCTLQLLLVSTLTWALINCLSVISFVGICFVCTALLASRAACIVNLRPKIFYVAPGWDMFLLGTVHSGLMSNCTFIYRFEIYSAWDKNGAKSVMYDCN